jgi:hypothetical protein
MLTIAQKAKILKMWNLNYTTRDIATELNVTRNVVAGILGRMRAAGKIGYRVRPTKEPKQRVPKAPQKIRDKKISRAKIIRRIAFNPIPQINKGEPGISILKLNYSTCRYIVDGEGPVASTFYCGKKVERGSYCECHANLCYIGREKVVNGRPEFQNKSGFAFNR